MLNHAKSFRLLVAFTLLLILAAAVYGQNLNNTQPVGVRYSWVNGISTKKDVWEKDTVQQTALPEFGSYLTSRSRPTSGIEFNSVYNTSVSFIKDLLECENQLKQQHTPVDLYSYSFKEALDTQPKGVVATQLTAQINGPVTNRNIYSYQISNTNYSSTSASAVYGVITADEKATVNAVMSDLKLSITAQKKAVCVGHSQGNFFCNLAYRILQADSDGFLKSRGITLPDSRWVEVVGIATPADFTADGRTQYVTNCGDIILNVPSSLAPSVNAAGIAPCLTPVGVKLNNDPTNSSLLSFFDGILNTLSENFYQNVVQAAFDYFAIRRHLIDTYLTESTEPQKQLMSVLENSLPDPGCKGIANCYIKDTFSSAGTPGINWARVEDTKSLGNTVIQSGGVMSITAGWASPSPTPVLPEKLSVRTRKVLTGPSTASFGFRTSGMGVTEIRLKKSIDNSTALSIKFDSTKNLVSVYPNTMSVALLPSSYSQFKTVTVTKSNTQVKMFIENVGTFASSKIMDGYYLEVYVESKAGFAGSQVIDLQNFLAARTSTSTPPPPPTAPTLTKLSCNPNPTTTQLATSCKLTGTNFNSSTQFAAFGGNCSISTGCSIIPDAISNSATNVDFSKQFAVSGIYSVKAKYATSTLWVTAPESIMVNAVVAPSPDAGSLSQSSLFIDAALVSYFSFEGNTNDSKGLNNGIGNAITFGTGKFGQSAGFTGSSYVTVPNSANLNPSQLTVSFWLQVGSLVSDSVPVSKWWSDQASWVMYIDGSGASGFHDKIRFNVLTNEASPSWNNRATSNESLTVGSWYHIVGTYDGSMVKLYINGQLQTETSSVSGTLRTSLANLQIGAWGNVNPLPDGSRVDDVAIFSRALTATEVSTIYSISASASTPTNGGDVNVAVVGYNNGVNCTLNGVNIIAPVVLHNQSAGAKALSCTAPTGYTISSISPSSVTLADNQAVTITVTVAAVVSSGFDVTAFNTSASVVAGYQAVFGLNLTPLNGFNNLVSVLISGLASGVSIVNSSLNFQVGPSGTTSFNLTLQTTGGTIPGSYPLLVTAQGAGITKTLGLTLNVTAPSPAQLSCDCYLSPNPITVGSLSTLFGNGSGGSPPYVYRFNDGQFQSSSSTVVQPGSVGVATYTVTVKDVNNNVASKSCSLTVNGVPPTISGMIWDSQPKTNTDFAGYINGSGFVAGSSVWLYGPGCLNGCQHPSAGVSVISLTQIRVVNIRLASGSYTLEVRTPYGSARSGSFSVN